MPRHYLYAEPPEMFLNPGDVPRGHDQDNIGRLQEIAPGRSPRLQVWKVRLHVLEHAPPPPRHQHTKAV